MSVDDEIWTKAILPRTASIAQAIRNLDDTAIKIVLVINEDGVLEGTVSDGDIRRGLLKGMDLQSPISGILHCNALVVPKEMERTLVLQLMVANKVHQIPVINQHHQIVGLYLWDEISAPVVRQNSMIIMAGGIGSRLRPHTEKCPKPLLPVAGKPIMEHIIERAKLEGFKNFTVAIHYLGYMIEEYFGDGERFGVNINYLHEQVPLGTAGALSLLRPIPETPFIVTNGDVISDIRYGELLDFHCQHDTVSATMAVRIHEWQNPFGVVQTNGVEIIGFDEKPINRCYINAGVYALEPSALSLLRFGMNCDMPTLFELLQSKSLRTLAYPMHEPWLDVGRPDDLHKANVEMKI
jgi:dTDP-glucose pyrophosphorylase